MQNTMIERLRKLANEGDHQAAAEWLSAASRFGDEEQRAARALCKSLAERVSAKDANKMIRKDLKRAFGKTCKFSVRKDGWTIYVSWVDGPTEEEVNAIVRVYEGQGFDGMQDMRYSKGPKFVNGRWYSFSTDFLFCRREYGPAMVGTAINQVCERYGVERELWPEVALHDDGTAYARFEKREPHVGGYWLSSHINMALAKISCFIDW